MVRKILFFLFSFIFVCAVTFSPCTVTAGKNVIVNGSAAATVIRIIDGDAIEVKLLNNDDTALVKLIGVDAQGFKDAVSFLTDYLLGQTVVISPDNGITTPVGIWNNMYVTLNGENVNKILIEKGYGITNPSYMPASQYNEYLTVQRTAKVGNIGIWENGVRENGTTTNFGNITYTGKLAYKNKHVVNINTASAETLINALTDMPAGTANAIINYRNKNPFNTIDEIKFVQGFSKELYDANKRFLTVCTNVNYADKEELFSIGNITEDEVEDILSYRRQHSKISSIAVLKDEKLLSQNRYSKYKDFLSTYDKQKVDVTENDKVVNVNTANQSQLTAAGLSSSDASKIIEHRKNGYTYKTLGELAKIPGIGLSTQQINEFEDNLNTCTDINEATYYEMRSVFGNDATKVIYKRNYNSVSDISEYVSGEKYDRIKNVIYVGSDDCKYINVNTATNTQLSEAGFSSSAASKLAAAKNMRSPSDLPCELTENDRSASLYTNINKATAKELKSLNHGVTDGIINEIMSYREEQPFGTEEEMRKFFTDRNFFGFYNSVKDYLVVR